jgi:hypothetical protein
MQVWATPKAGIQSRALATQHYPAVKMTMVIVYAQVYKNTEP